MNAARHHLNHFASHGMIMSTVTRPRTAEIIYPDNDGKPMSDNTLQFEWIVTIKGGLDALFRHDPSVFVAGDLLWYPVEGSNTIRAAPDAMVVFNRPKGYRGSYQQWREGGISPAVVFEIQSPSNRMREMLDKFRFYETYGVQEYYHYNPDHRLLDGWQRVDGRLEEIPAIDGWVSPRLGIRFDLSSGDLRIIGPDGRPFLTYVELAEQSDDERKRAEAERQRADAQQQRADAERSDRERLAAQLRALGVEPEV
jgi:Uma2 family endonuclease